VFLQHFPALRPGLEIAERKGSAVKAFEARLEREARLDGMVNPPWTPEIFIPVITTMTEFRALSGGLSNPFSFNHRTSGGTLVVFPGDLQIAAGLAPDVHTDVLVRQFCEWLTATQRWPEAASIRDEWDLLHQAAQDTAAKLKITECLVSVTSRCYLCRQHDGRLIGPIVPPSESEE